MLAKPQGWYGQAVGWGGKEWREPLRPQLPGIVQPPAAPQPLQRDALEVEQPGAGQSLEGFKQQGVVSRLDAAKSVVRK